MTSKRRFTRIPFDTLAFLVSDTARHETELLDISLNGALVNDPQANELNLDDTVRLEVHLQDPGKVITMVGHIAHRENERLGIHCETIDLDSITQLRRLVELNLDDPGMLHRELAALLDAN